MWVRGSDGMRAIAGKSALAADSFHDPSGAVEAMYVPEGVKIWTPVGVTIAVEAIAGRGPMVTGSPPSALIARSMSDGDWNRYVADPSAPVHEASGMPVSAQRRVGGLTGDSEAPG